MTLGHANQRVFNKFNPLLDMEKELELPKMEVTPEIEVTEPAEVEEVIEIEDEKEDPLDTLSEDELRAEAKKLRAINSRFDRKNKVVETKPVTPYITRDEFYATNRTKAIETLTNVSENDPLADVKKDLNENWNDVMTFYVARNGQDTTEKIIEDVFDAYTVWKRRQNPVADDSARLLQATTVLNPTGGKPEVKKESESQGINFNIGTSVDKWYKKKE